MTEHGVALAALSDRRRSHLGHGGTARAAACRGGVTAVGVLAPAAEEVDGLQPCHTEHADGMLVCAAERGVGGTVSAGLFRPTGEPRWREAHADAGWICAALRALVSEGALESGEAGTMPNTSWDETQAVDDEL